MHVRVCLYVCMCARVCVCVCAPACTHAHAHLCIKVEVSFNFHVFQSWQAPNIVKDIVKPPQSVWGDLPQQAYHRQCASGSPDNHQLRCRGPWHRWVAVLWRQRPGRCLTGQRWVCRAGTCGGCHGHCFSLHSPATNRRGWLVLGFQCLVNHAMSPRYRKTDFNMLSITQCCLRTNQQKRLVSHWISMSC